MSVHELGNPFPDEVNLGTHLADLEAKRFAFFSLAATYAHRPTSDSEQNLKTQGANGLIQSFANTLVYVAAMSEPLEFKFNIIQQLQKEEDSKRVEKINSIVGKNLLQPGTISLEPPEEDNEETTLKTVQAGVNCFTSFLSADVQRLINHAEEKLEKKAKRIHKISEIATITGSVALGIIIARRIDPRA